MSPARRRDAVRFLVKRRRSVSERRACQLVGQHRSTQRYEPVPAEYELRLVARMNELAALHPRYGYRRIWALLRAEGWRVNRKRIERLWRLEGHRVPPRRSQTSGKRAQGTAEQAIWSLPAQRPNHVWSYDFMGTRTRDGSPVRILNVVDEYTRVGARLPCRPLDRRRRGDQGTRTALRPARPARGVALRQRTRVRRRQPDRLAERARSEDRLHRERQPAAERVRRALQRHHARRAPQRRRVRQPARGPRRHRQLARSSTTRSAPTAASAC